MNDSANIQIGDLTSEVLAELRRDSRRLSDFSSMHEGYGFIREGVEKAWDEIRANNPQLAAEHIKLVAARSVRFIEQYGETATPRPTHDRIIRAVVKNYGISVVEMQSATRKYDVVLARHVAMYLLKKYTRLTLMDIGGLLGGRDHTSVIHGIRSIKDRMETERETRIDIETLEKSL